MTLSKLGTAYGTCFIFHTIRASVNQLIKALGNPHYTGTEDEKTQYEWDFRITKENSVFTIYDWKEYREYSRDEIIEWHIGGFPSKCNLGHTDMKKVKEELGKLGLVVN